MSLTFVVIITTGGISISKWIQNNHTLQVISISSNPIGDEGIAAIGRSLDDASIKTLVMRKCEITIIGA